MINSSSPHSPSYFQLTSSRIPSFLPPAPVTSLPPSSPPLTFLIVTSRTMSASTAALSGIPFRKLNIDQYDEDTIHPSSLYTPDPRPSSQILQDTQSKDRKVRGMLQSSQVGDALKECLREGEWPYGEDSDHSIKQAKAIQLSLILSVLNSSRSTDIPNLVQTLDSSEQVLLMKYLYKAMENLGDSSGNAVLGWHEKLTEVAGIGCIVRVMTDRRRV